MNTAITTIYCLTDDFLKAKRHHEDPQCTVSDAEVITVALTAARFFSGNFEHAWDLLTEHAYIPKRLSRSQFNRRLHRVTHWLEALFEYLASIWKQTGEQALFLIDSFPVSVCDNIRIPRSRIYPLEATEEAFRGYMASKRRYFYGLRVHMLTNEAGLPVEVFFTPGRENDTGQLKNFAFDLPEGSTVYGDKAYNEYFTEDLLKEACGITLLPLRKKNSKRGVAAYVEYLQQYYRKRIETAFSSFERLLPKSIHAVTARGFELKVFLFVLALSFDGLL